MTDSTDSIQNNEETEEVKKVEIVTADVLNAIASESEQIKLSGSKASNQFRVKSYSSKQSVQEDSAIGNISENKLPVTVTQSDLKNPDIPGVTINNVATTDNLETLPVSNNSIPNSESINENVSSDTPQPIIPQLDVVPECMYSVLQQRAQNVLKMISDRKYPENTLSPQSGNINPPSSASTHSQSSRQSVENKSNESVKDRIFKTSNLSSKDQYDVKSLNASEHKIVNITGPEGVSINFSYNPSKQHNVPKSVIENSSNKSPEKPLPTSMSEQSSRSTEQCTTYYSSKSASSENPIGEDVANRKLQEQCAANPSECVSVKTTYEMGFDNINQVLHEQSNDNEMMKKLSQIVDSNELPIKLSKKGQLICQLFRQKLLLKLEATGNVDESSANIASLTALKFATWMEDILKEIDSRKNFAKENQGIVSNNPTETKEKEHQELISSSEDSVTKNVETNENQSDEESEVIKMQELTENELIQKYGSYLLRDSYDLFEFVGPDNVPVEVRHITAVISKKIMIVKKKTSETQWSNWVIEVGPEVSLDSVSEIEQQLALNGEIQKQIKETEAGKWNIRKTDWDYWKPDIFKQKITYCRIPILKKQCMMTEDDFAIEYPPYPIMYSQPTREVSVFEETLEEGLAVSQASKGDTACRTEQNFL